MGVTGRRFQVDIFILRSIPPHPGCLAPALQCSGGGWLLWEGGPSPTPPALIDSSPVSSPCPLVPVLVPGGHTILCWFLNSGHTFVNSPFIRLLFCPLPPVKHFCGHICCLLGPRRMDALGLTSMGALSLAHTWVSQRSKQAEHFCCLEIQLLALAWALLGSLAPLIQVLLVLASCQLLNAS